MAIRKGKPKEDIKDYEMIDSKKVCNYDGFWTDLTWYRNKKTGIHVLVVGDIDIYPPDRDNCDWYCDTYEDAKRYFDSDIFIV